MSNDSVPRSQPDAWKNPSPEEASSYGTFAAGSWQNTPANAAQNPPLPPPAAASSSSGAASESTGWTPPSSTDNTAASGFVSVTPPAPAPPTPPGAPQLAPAQLYPSAQGSLPPSTQSEAQPGYALNFQQIQPGIIPLRPLNLGEIFNGAFQAMRQAPAVMFGLVLGMWAVMSVIVTTLIWLGSKSTLFSDTLINDSNLDDPSIALTALSDFIGQTIPGLIVNAILGIVITSLTLAIITSALASLVLGRRPSPGDAWHGAAPSIGKILLFSLLQIAISTVLVLWCSLPIGIMLLRGLAADFEDITIQDIGFSLMLFLLALTTGIVAYIFISIKLLFTVPCLVMENATLGTAMKRSWQLTKGSFWRITGIMILTYLIIMTLISVLGAVGGFIPAIASFIAPDNYGVVIGASVFFQNILNGIYMPFLTGVSGLLYIDVRMRREGLALTLLRTVQQS